MFHRLAPPLVLLLALACYVAILFGQVAQLDRLRPVFSAYPAYMPGQPQPAVGCETLLGWEYDYGGVAFACTFEGADTVHSYGANGVITGAFVELRDARAGDVLALLEEPLPMPTPRRTRSRFYAWQGSVAYWFKPRSMWQRVRFISLWQART